MSGGWVSGRVGSFVAPAFPDCACGAGEMTTCENEAAPPHPNRKTGANIAICIACLLNEGIKVIVVVKMLESPSI